MKLSEIRFEVALLCVAVTSFSVTAGYVRRVVVRCVSDFASRGVSYEKGYGFD